LFENSICHFYKDDDYKNLSNESLSLLNKSNIIQRIGNFIQYYKPKFEKIINSKLDEIANTLINEQASIEKEGDNMKVDLKRNIKKFKETTTVYFKRNYYFISQKYILNEVNNIAKYTNGLKIDTDDADGYFHYSENGCGGGVLIGQENSNVSIENCTISNNTSEKNGGGVALIEAKSYPTTIKNSTIKDNKSNARGAGVYYDATSKLNMCGADIVQDNMYDNHLNNVNVLSTANPIYVTGSLEGSKIGLSDPRLWDDNMTDAQARDDGSAELLTNGYKANNSDVHPSEYFTSDHDTWIVDRTFPTMTEKTVRTRYKYSPTRYPVTSNIPL
jgi:hypothetical protein